MTGAVRGEEARAPVNDAAIVGRVLREYHLRGAGPAMLRRVGGAAASGVVTYLADPDGTAPWVVRACRDDAPVPVHVSRTPAVTMRDWLMAQASTLVWLEAAGYPAPRVIRTHSGDPVGLDGIWLTLATSFVEGPVIRPSLEQLRMLGAALGRLHALDVARGSWGGHRGIRRRPSRPPWPGSTRSRCWCRMTGGTCMPSFAGRRSWFSGVWAGCPGE